MGQKSSIEWTDATWNPVRGCSRVSEGCRNCYAERVAARFSGSREWGAKGGPLHRGGDPFFGFATVTPSGPRWTGKVELVEEHLADPLRWKKPKRIFVNSMSDLFHENLPDEAIDRVFAVMASCPQHTFQVLTKRAANMRRVMTEMYGRYASRWTSWPLPNVWLGVSVEDQATADARIPLLLQTPAAVRFVSYEPALGHVDFMPWLTAICSQCGQAYSERACGPTHAVVWNMRGRTGNRLDWIIAGGESGPGARPFDIHWARDVIAQCKEAGVACFVKQLGAAPSESSAACYFEGVQLEGLRAQLLHVTLKDRKGGDWDVWPPDLRVREFPVASTEPKRSRAALSEPSTADTRPANSSGDVL
jgi:protein gp37